MLRDEKKHFRFVVTGHILESCRTSYKCYNCQGQNHRTSICEQTTNIDNKKYGKSQKSAFKDNGENERKQIC